MGVAGAIRSLGRHLAAFPLLAWTVVATVVYDTAFETAVPLIVSWIVDRAVVAGRPDLFLVPAALMAGGWVASVVVQICRDGLLADLTARVSGRIRNQLGNHVSGLPFPDLRNLKAAQWAGLQGPDLAQVENLLLNVLPPFLFGVFYLVLGLTAMVYTNALLGTAVLLGLPLTLVGPWLLARKSSSQGAEVRQGETQTLAAAADLLSAQPLVRTFDLGEAFSRGFRDKVAALGRSLRRFSFTTNLTRRLPNLTIHLAQVAIILGGTWLALVGRLGLGEFLAFNLLFANVLTAVLDLASTLGPLARAAPSLENLDSRRDSTPAADAVLGPGPAIVPVRRMESGLRFENVSFSYLPGRPVLDGASFAVPPGRRTAVVGASGSGKSTLVSLAAGLYRPDRGRILWDQVDLVLAARPSFLGRLGVVFQDNPVFDATLGNNVALREPLAGDEGAIWEALEAAGLADWVRDLPGGLGTRAGEGGGFLSGGQRQRLALARALFRRPELLILDEATSALDPLTEAQVNASLRALTARGSTTVLHITHRLQGIADYDQIVVLGGGRVLESGTHATLLGHPGGPYATLWARQSGLVVEGPGGRITPGALRAIPLFSSSSPETLVELARSFVAETADGGTRLIRQGQPGSRFFVIARGRVEVSIDTPRGETSVATLSDGDFFGEMSLLGSALTSAHVTASAPTVLLTLEKSTFLVLVERDPVLGAYVAEFARQRREENLRRAEGR